MGNTGSSSSTRRRQIHPPLASTQYVVTAPSQYPNPNLPTNYYYNYNNNQNYHRCPAPPPQLEHQRAVTIRNEVNVKKETIVVLEDPENPGTFLLAFTFDAISPGSITVAFFAKEGDDCELILTKEDKVKQVGVLFEEGLAQKFRQPSGTGIDFSEFDETELRQVNGEGVYPLVLKAEACSVKKGGDGLEGNSNGNCYIALAVFDKREKDEYGVRVLKQFIWVNGMRHELQEIYGIGNSVDVESDGGDPGKECVVCMTEPRDTTVLPCRHMCLCRGCAQVLHLQKHYRCPICRQPVERLLEIKVNDETEG